MLAIFQKKGKKVQHVENLGNNVQHLKINLQRTATIAAVQLLHA